MINKQLFLSLLLLTGSTFIKCSQHHKLQGTLLSMFCCNAHEDYPETRADAYESRCHAHLKSAGCCFLGLAALPCQPVTCFTGPTCKQISQTEQDYPTEPPTGWSPYCFQSARQAAARDAAIYQARQSKRTV